MVLMETIPYDGNAYTCKPFRNSSVASSEYKWTTMPSEEKNVSNRRFLGRRTKMLYAILTLTIVNTAFLAALYKAVCDTQRLIDADTEEALEWIFNMDEVKKGLKE